MKQRDRLQLFRVVRKGYDPEEVMDCLQDLVQAFSQRERTHDYVQGIYLQEIMLLKIAVDEGQAHIETLRRQIDRLTQARCKTDCQGAQEPPSPPQEVSSV